jgi:ABC-2 type transport system ATP-binding protein
VGILAKGKMLASGRIEDLVNKHEAQSVEVVCDGVVGDDLAAIKRKATRILQRGVRCLIILPGQDHLEEVLAILRHAGGKLVSVIPHKG